MKNYTILLIILSSIAWYCEAPKNTPELCNGTNVFCEDDKTYDIQKLESLDTAIDYCLSHVGWIPTLKIIRNDKSYKNMVYCKSFSQSGVQIEPPAIDFCINNIITGVITAPSGGCILDSVLFRGECPLYFLKLNVVQSGGGTPEAHPLQFNLVTEILPDSVKIHIKADFYDVNYKLMEGLTYEDTVSEF